MTDYELLERFFTEKNNEWLGYLLERYTLLVLGVCMKYLKDEEEAKDSVQQIFLKVIQELHKYKVEYFKSWLYMITKNHCLMKLREKQVKSKKEISEHVITLTGQETVRQQFLETDLSLELMQECLKELNAEQQRCITLFYLEKKSYQQISGLTGYTMMQVKSYIQNGKRNLRILLEKKLKNQMLKKSDER
ncbi:MAG: sigma-70 family RNA polymerase sigma factor [Chitinophagaceae bacterium]|nr:sigma-70 family RNA polymerase sigma factor [Chitinophagaceae bacterium]